MTDENWVTQAPRRMAVIVVGGVAQAGESVAPTITFGFQGIEVEPITVTLIHSELDLRRFQKTLGKEIDKAVKRAREIERG